MNVAEVMRNVMQTSAAVEIMNELVLATLVSSRDTCIGMREILEAKRKRKGYLNDREEEDWQMVVLDIAALDRVIDYYGG